MRIKNYLLALFLILSTYSFYAQIGTPFAPRLPGGGLEVRGNIKLVGNTILGHTTTMPTFNAAGQVTNLATLTAQANAATDNGATGQNDTENMEYIDIDGIASTFSSSSANLDIDPSITCKRIAYAGLYWAATYPYERSVDPNAPWTSFPANTPRGTTWNQVKFKMPGEATYRTLVADNAADPVGDEDSIIFDGYNSSNIANSTKGAPYVCYKNVTALLQTLADANGTYTVADLVAARGRRQDGTSGGWSLVVIYESPSANVKPRFFGIYDGYANITGSTEVAINMTGFRTNATGKVEANIGVAALDGDREKGQDRYLFKSASAPVGPAPLLGFIKIKDSFNNEDNFFDSSITDNNAIVSNINPIKKNTYGFDLDQVSLPNPGQAVLANNETGATIKLTTLGSVEDNFAPFIATFSVDNFVPNIALTKTVQDLAGNDIDSEQLSICEEFRYIIGFQNLGSDDAVGVANANFILITDTLPQNITFIGLDLSSIPGATYTYNAVTRLLEISIPKGYFEVGDPRYEFSIRVRAACSCNEITNACSSAINNQAFITYQGEINGEVHINDPSSSVFDSTCQIGNGSATNSLIFPCIYESTVYLCGNSATLTAANGYDTYSWTGPAGATILPNTTSQTVTVNQTGDYTVNGTDDLCNPITQIFHVSVYASSILNPIIPYNESIPMVTCPNDGRPLPYIFLCGAADSQLIETGISDALSIVWEQLNTASCAAVVPITCPNENPACTWNQVGSGPNFTVSNAGQYRIIINYPNGCRSIFYFNVFKNLLAPTIVATDIFCTTPGCITVNNVPSSGYEFQLSNAAGTVIVPWQASNQFCNILVAGNYTVTIRQTGFAGGCPFTIPNIGIINRNFTVTTSSTQPICFGDPVSITLSANNVRPQYYFILHSGSLAGPIVGSVGPVASNTYTFTNLTPGVTYYWEVSTDDGCYQTGNIPIANAPQLFASSAITRPLTLCGPGEITVTASGGTPGPGTPPVYYYYVNTTPPAGAFTTNPVIPVSASGTYTITVLDTNSCQAVTTQTIVQVVPPAFTVTHQDISCATSPNAGTITFNVSNANGSAVLYSINGPAGPFLPSNTFTNLPAGTYSAVVQYTTGTAVCTTTPIAVVIDAANAITVSATATPYICSSTPALSSTITVTAGGGAGGFTYSINGTTFQASNQFVVILPGTYTITIRDINGCIATTQVIIAPITPPTDIVFASTPLTCNAANTATSTVTLTVVGGSGAPTGLMYQITAPAAFATAYQVSNVFSNLLPGTYTFQVRDDKGCTYSESYQILPLPSFNVTPTVVSNVQCFGTATGVIRFTVASFTTTYSYVVTGPGGYSVPLTVTSLPTVTLPAGPAGLYTITVTNTATSCTDTETITIAGPSAALILSLSTTPYTCISTGTVTASAVGGWGGYVYSVSPSVGVIQSGNVFSNFVPGTLYTFTVRDSSGCTDTETFTFTAPIQPVLSLTASEPCYDSTNGASMTVTVNPGTGLAPFQFSLNGQPYVSNGTNTYTFSPLTPGSYNVQVLDANGCTDTLDAPFVVNPQVTLNTVLTRGFSCFTGIESAIITGTIGGGYPNYNYYVSYNGALPYVLVGNTAGPTFTYTIPTSSPGTYQFEVRDAQGCNVFSTVTTLNALVPVAETHTQVNNTCFGDTNGSVTITPSGGVAPYTVDFNSLGYSSVFTYSGLAAGTYPFIVKDSNDCTVSSSVTITQNPDIVYTSSFTSLQCGGPTGTVLGTITINTLSGGVAPYTLTLVDLSGLTPNVVVSPATAPHTFNNLEFGSYEVIITDAVGCFKRETFMIASPVTNLTIDVTAVPGNCTTGACIKLTAIGGTGPYYFAQYPIVSGSTPPYDYASNMALYQPESPLGSGESTFCGLASNVLYSFIVYDQGSNCYYFRQATSPTPVYSPLTVTTVASNVKCKGDADGSVTFTISNHSGTLVSYQIFNSITNLPIAPAVNVPVVVGTPYTVSNVGPLAVGTYYVLIRELNGPFVGCTNSSAIFSITESPTILTITANLVKNANCNANGIITALGNGGTAPYRYYFVLSPGAAPVATSPLWTSTNTVTLPANALPYNAYVIDANGCIRMAQVTIGMDPVPDLAVTIVNRCAAQGGFALNVTLPTPGIAPHAFSIDGGAFQVMTAPFTVSGLSSGPHYVIVRDNNGCTDRVDVNILAPLSASAVFFTPPTCNSASGEIRVTASGGSGSYTYTINPPTAGIVTTPTGFINVPPGNYVITVSDPTTTCSITVNVNLAPADPVSFIATTTPVRCFGDSNGTLTVALSANNDDAPYTYQIIAGPAGYTVVGTQNSPIFTGLPAGNYSVEVVSARGCRLTQNYVVGTPSTLTATAQLPNPVFTCTNNVVNTTQVEILVTAGTGTAPYTYSIDGINFFANNIFNVAGSTTSTTTVNYTVKDANGCLFLGNIIIPQISVLSASIFTNQVINCVNTGQIITINASGGSGNYSYSTLPPGAANVTQGIAPNDNQFTITAPGTYYFRVTDNITGCYIDTVAYPIAEYNTIDVVAVATKPVTCFGGNDGTLEITVTGYTGNYSYEVIDSLGGTVMTGTGNTSSNPLQIPLTLPPGLPAGNYTVEVTETDVTSALCTAVSNVINIGTPSAPLVIDARATANVSCDNNAGVIVATATGGWTTAPYTYTISPVAGTQTSPGVFTGLSAALAPGTVYTITVTDALGCTDAMPVTLIRPTQITANAIANINLNCFGDTNGTVTVTGTTGGQGSNYTYTLNYINPALPSSGPQTSNVFSGLGAGSYSININDGYNCLSNAIPFNVIPRTELIAALTEIPFSQSCIDGSKDLILSASGGVEPYSYSTSATGPFGGSFTSATPVTLLNVPVGTHTYYVQDANGCISNASNGVTIEIVPPLQLNILDNTDTEINCFGGNDAHIYVQGVGGLGNYTYELVDNATATVIATNATGIFPNLLAGNYTVYLYSGNPGGNPADNCTPVSVVIQINQPSVPFAVTFVPTNVQCFGDDTGAITLTFSGYRGSVQFQISPVGNPNDVATFDVTNPAVPFVITGLTAGTYDINIMDNPYGCPVILSVPISQPLAALSGAITFYEDEECAEQDLGSITISNIAGGTAPYSVNYTVAAPGTPSTGPVLLALGDTDHTFGGLNGATYTVIITDANGCTVEYDQIIGGGDLYTLDVLVTYPCINNQPGVQIEVLNTTSPNTFGAGYSFQLDGFAPQTAQTVTNPHIFTSANPIYTASLLTAGTHDIYVISPKACPKEILDIPVAAPQALQVDIAQLGLNEVVGNAQFGVQPYVNYTFYLNNFNNEVSSGPSNSFIYEESGNYAVEVTDSSGCTARSLFRPFVFIPIFIPNVFTPNGNNTNEMWGPTNTANYKNLKTKIYDRYGRMVAELGEGQFWDGKYSGNELPSGDYWYVIKVDGNNDREYVGHFTLYR